MEELRLIPVMLYDPTLEEQLQELFYFPHEYAENDCDVLHVAQSDQRFYGDNKE